MGVLINRKTVWFLLTVIALFAPTGSYAAQDNVPQQVRTAAQSANFAGQATNVEQTQLHLHQVINCLVGPGGEDFNATAGYPCEGQGAGALNDISDQTEERLTLERALALAKVGAQIPSFQAAHYTALAVSELLKEAQQGK